MTKPVRIRRSRAKGARLVSPNGLPIVSVSRPSKWANPFATGLTGATPEEKRQIRLRAVAEFERALRRGSAALSCTITEARSELGGKNLACWCPLDGACHADLLLQLANEPEKK